VEHGVSGQPHKTPHFNSRHRYTPLPRRAWSGVTASALVSDVSAPACTNGIWPPLRPVSVVQKNKPSTMSSSNVQSIDLPMDCTAVAILAFKKWGGQTGANQNCGGAILKPLTIRQFVAFMALLWFCTKFNNVFFHLYRDETKTCLNMPMIVSKHCLAKRIMVPDTVT